MRNLTTTALLGIFLATAGNTLWAGVGSVVANFDFDARSIEINPVSNRLYVGSAADRTVRTFDGATLQQLEVQNVSGVPGDIALSPDGKNLYVITDAFTGVLSYPLSKPANSKQLLAGCALSAVVAGNNQMLYVTPKTGACPYTLRKMDLVTGNTADTYSGGTQKGDGLLALSPDRNTLYFSVAGANAAIIARYDLTGGFYSNWQNADSELGSGMTDLQVSPDNQYLYFVVASGATASQIARIRTQDMALSGIAVPSYHPQRIVVSPDNLRAYVVNASNHLDVWNLQTGKKMFQGDLAAGQLVDMHVDSTGAYLFASFAPAAQGGTGSLRVYSTGMNDDSDGDGVKDYNDMLPFNGAETVDTDGDGTGDNSDTDDDSDGVQDVSDNCSLVPNVNQANVDGDALGDACDSDNDNDGVPDSADALPHNVAASVDTDGDGYPDQWNAACNVACQAASGLFVDNCPLLANPGLADRDSDGVGDACDNDYDNDGVADNVDNCPQTANPDQWNTDYQIDSLGNACDDDDDGDGVADVIDNCPLGWNADQADLDADGLGNACDTDADNDGVLDGDDQDDDNDGVLDTQDDLPLNASESVDTDLDGIGNNADDDDDGDGYPDGSDLCALIDNYSNPDSCAFVDVPGHWKDTDRDGIEDAIDPHPLVSDAYLEGGGGNYNESEGSDSIYEMTALSDGRVACAGVYETSRGLLGIFVKRLLPSGVNDPAFNNGSSLRMKNSEIALYVPQAIVVQSDGKLVVAGFKRTLGGVKALLLRLNEDGTLDKSFGKGGKVLSKLGRLSALSSIVQQPDGKLLVAGAALPSKNSHHVVMLVARFLPDGKLDTAFGSKGMLFGTVGAGDTGVNALLLQKNGSIVLAGEAVGPDDSDDFAVVRLNDHGVLDQTFANGGISINPIGHYHDVPFALIQQMDGKLVAAGYSSMNWSDRISDRNLALIRYNSDGSLDTTFGTGGKQVPNLFPDIFADDGEGEITGLLQLPNGKLLVSGTISHVFGIAILEANGALATTENNGGVTTTRMGDGLSYANALLQQADGTIWLAGAMDADQFYFPGKVDSAVQTYSPGDSDGDGVPDPVDRFPLDTDNNGGSNVDEMAP